MNALAAVDGLGPIDLRFDGDYYRLYTEWLEICSPLRHLKSWWLRRHEPNVLFLHYADLSADLEGEMRRVAGFLGLVVPEALWPAVTDRCSLASMRRSDTGLDRLYEGGAASFFHKGGSGRWRGVVPDEIIDDYTERVMQELPASAAEWLEHGSSVLRTRPDQMA